MGDTAAAQSNDSGQGQTTDQGGAGDGPVVDFGQILAQHQAELARTGQTVENLRKELGDSHETLGRVKKAFAGDEGEKLTPYQQRVKDFQELEAYLDEQTLENQRAGGAGLPITAKIGKNLARLGIESEQRAERLEAELAEIKEQIKRQQNPAFQGLERAAFIMEGMVDEGLQQLYGADKDSRSIRAAQFNAVTARINEEIKDLMKNDPEALLKVQRNPKIMRNMVNQFMAEMLPPKVRNMLDDERIKNEPMDSRTLFQAFAEAREQYNEAVSKGDERKAAQFSNLITDIRRDILANQYGGNRGGGGGDKPSLNKLLGSMLGGR